MRGWRHHGWRGVVVLPLLALALMGCGDGDETALQEAEEEGTAEGLVGEQITVSGEVERVLSPQAFLIGGEFLSLGVEEGTLVFGAAMPTVSEEGFVQVTGTVREFVIADLQDEFGVDFGDDEFFVEYEEEFAIAAEQVEFIPESADEGTDTRLEEAEEEGVAGALVGEQITIGGEVEAVISPNAFRIFGSEPGEGTLVISVNEADVTEGALAQATGTVKEFVIIDIEEEFGIDLDDDLFDEAEDEFAVVADTVEAVPQS